MCILENFDIIHQKYNLMTFVYYVAVDLEVCITGTNKDSYFLCHTVTVYGVHASLFSLCVFILYFRGCLYIT